MKGSMIESMEIKECKMQGLVVAKKTHAGHDEDFLFTHNHQMIQQTPSHTSKIMAIIDFQILTPWSC
jgi:hypothetical protein